MVKLQKFLFDTDFGPPRIATVDIGYDEQEAVVIEEPAEPPPPTFSEEELALARDQAFEAGRQSGLQEASTSLQQMLGMAMASCAHHLQGLGAAQQAANAERTKDAVAVALAVMRKVQPEFCRLFGLTEIEAAVRESLAHLDRVTRITLKVHPELVAGLREKADDLIQQTSFDGKLIIAEDASIALGDCRLDWGDGGAERDQAKSWAEIDRAVEAALGNLHATLGSGIGDVDG